MSSPGYEVVDDELRTFAEKLRSTADKIDASGNVVHDLGSGVQIGTWGLVGQLFSIGVRNSARGTGDKLHEGANHVRDAASGVDNSAQAYLDNDSYLANGFGGE